MPRNEEATNLEGRAILGYDLTKYIDSGASADVYRAERDGRVFALKLYRAWVTDGDPVGHRRAREISALRALDHPHVCRYEASDIVIVDAKDRHVLVMEFIEGESLTEAIKRTGALSPETFRPRALELLDAVRAMHATGVTHRDIKPDNVRVEATTGRYVLVDFGVVGNLENAEADRLTDSQTFLGTTQWSAPEWLFRDPPEAASSPMIDVYGVGLTFYYMLTGGEPFGDVKNWAQLVDAVRTRHISFKPIGFPRRTQTVLQSMIWKKPDIRPTIDEASAALVDADAPTSASRPTVATLKELLGSSVEEAAMFRAQRLSRQANVTILEEAAYRVQQSIEAAIANHDVSKIGAFDWVESSRIDNAGVMRTFFGADDQSPASGLRAVDLAPGDGAAARGGTIAFSLAGTPEDCTGAWILGTIMPETKQRRWSPRTVDRFLGTATAVEREMRTDASGLVDRLVEALVGANADPPVEDNSFVEVLRLGVAGLSVTASHIATHFVLESDDGAHRPRPALDDVQKLVRTSDGRLREAIEELEARKFVEQVGDGTFLPGFVGELWPKPLLFSELDGHFKDWTPRDDARTLAHALLNHSGHVRSEVLAKQLGWQRRRLNPALYLLEHYGACEWSKELTQIWIRVSICRNSRTAAFARGE